MSHRPRTPVTARVPGKIFLPRKSFSAPPAACRFSPEIVGGKLKAPPRHLRPEPARFIAQRLEHPADSLRIAWPLRDEPIDIAGVQAIEARKHLPRRGVYVDAPAQGLVVGRGQLVGDLIE